MMSLYPSSSGSGHDAATCPQVVAGVRAEQKADNVRQGIESTPKPQRGATEFVNLQVDELPSSALLLSDDEADTETFFDSGFEAKKYRERLLTPKTQIDMTIPQTRDQLKAHVKVLFMAFKCVPTECQEGENIKRPFTNEIHENARVECLCWEILEACIRRSQVSMNLVETHEPEKYKFKKGMDKTFEERFNLIVNGMARSKSMCKHLFDAPYMLKVIDDPQTNTERIDSNRKLNGQKAQVMKRGKEVVAQEGGGRTKRRKIEDEDVDNDDGEENSSISMNTPRRRQRASAAPRAAVSSMYTPARSMLSTQQAMSAPVRHSQSMMPSSYRTHAQPQSYLQAGLMQQRSNTYNTTPTRGNNPQAMAPRSMLGVNQSSPYATGYGQSNANPYASAYPPPALGQYSMQPFSQMAPQNYAPMSNVRSNQSQFGSTSNTRAQVQAASQYPDPTTPHHLMSTNSTWLARPQAETTASTSGYSSGASTVSPNYSTAAASQLSSPEFKPAVNEGLADETANTFTQNGDFTLDNDGLTDDSANTFTQNEDFIPDNGTGHNDINDILRQAEADHENAQHRGHDQDEDAAYETEATRLA